jgi:hypothetical protein
MAKAKTKATRPPQKVVTSPARDAKRDKLEVRMEVRQHILDKVQKVTMSSGFSPEAKAMFEEERERLYRRLAVNYGHGTTHAIAA